MRSALYLLALVFAISVPTARAMESNQEKPFAIPRERIVNSVRHIGFMPMNIPANVPNREKVTQRLEAAIEAQMRAGGFDIVPAAAMRVIRDDLADALGGLYDPITGKPNEAQLKRLEELSREQYEKNREIDVWLHAAVVVRKATASGGQASWDGVVESASGLSAPGSPNADGKGALPGLSLMIRLVDNNGKALFVRYGGLQLTRVFVAGGGRARQVAVDPGHLLEDVERDKRALMIALQPLASGVEPPAPAKMAPVSPVPVVANADALRLPRNELLSAHPRVALLPLSSAEALGAASNAGYRDLLATRLKSAGFEIVDAAEAGAALDKLQKSAPGFFDPLTGDFEEARWNAARLNVLKQQGQRLGVQAIVDPAVAAVPTPSLGVRIIDVEGRILFEELAELPGKPEADARVVDLLLRELVPAAESGKKR